MPDALFAHARLAPIYDAFDGPRDDLEHYLGIIGELGAKRVLDVGCGTGSLAVLLAARGIEVVGVDPAEASLEVAKAKDPEGRITWIHGDAKAVGDVKADLAVMTGNVAQVFLTDDEWRRTLEGVRTALVPGGHLVFETRRPGRRAWEGWAADPAHEVIDVPGVGEVEQWREVTEVNLPFVSFRCSYRFSDGEVVTSDSTLWFRERDELEALLAEHGFRVLDVRDAPDRPGREYVFIAQRD
ncbi:class I SAM-dependent methyltransferase [Amycolatopsis roodepoortensis]|uniref:SAM-dependent methyltransferase n=1 Tax=Amycolatopsis roodepoortensis TaxID=700274 RepID=A0ABR9L7X1_9PSEU|nr:class I SAM-dependent methyltransferase [Amycolatopsis roodepoortensis]MBE1576251.1 SAM-dependent methyltransferase [Amycolatopsis roodepoortensis]